MPISRPCSVRSSRAARVAILAAGLVGLAGWTMRDASAQSDERWQAARRRMVDEFIVREGVRNERVVQSMRTTPRHEFVPPAIREQAYQDGALPIGYKQTISPPFVVAYMTETIDPQPGDRVLEIGTGSGYQAAVLAPLCKEVYSIEIVEQLGRTAGTRLTALGYKNVFTKVGDGYLGWPDKAPFDKIIVTCSPENVPQPLVEQLREGGRLLIPLGERYQQVFHLFEKKDGELQSRKLIPTLFVPMTGLSEEQRQVQPDPSRPVLVNGGFEADENGDGRVDGWHYQRQAALVESADARDKSPEGKRHLRFESSESGRLAQALQGMAVDGRSVATLRFVGRVRLERVAVGLEKWEQPSLMVHFYDSVRKPIGESIVGPWTGSGEWKEFAYDVRVPPAAREAVVRIGLNGGTGKLELDDLRMTATAR